MFSHKETTAQLDRKYRNVAEEGRGSHRYYLQKKRANNRKLLEVMVFFVIMIFVVVWVFSLVDGHGYFEQWKVVFDAITSHTSGHVNDSEIK